jgi:hypothetical protein
VPAQPTDIGMQRHDVALVMFCTEQWSLDTNTFTCIGMLESIKLFETALVTLTPSDTFAAENILPGPCVAQLTKATLTRLHQALNLKIACLTTNTSHVAYLAAGGSCLG